MRYSCVTDYKNLDYSNANWYSSSEDNRDSHKSLFNSLINTLCQNNLSLVTIGRENKYLLSEIQKNQSSLGKLVVLLKI